MAVLRLPILHVFLLLVLAAPPLAAQDDLQGDADTANMVRVVTQHGRAAQCIATLAVNRIDGEPAVVPAAEFFIEAGVHSINGRATLDTSRCPFDLEKLQISRAADLEINFETGYVYYLGYDYRSPDPAQWQLVAWRVDQDDGTRTPLAVGEPTGNRIQ